MVAAAAAIIAGSIVYANSHGGASSGPQPTPTPTRIPTTSAPPTPRGSPTHSVNLQHWRVRGFLDDLNVDVFARSDSALYRIQTAKQLVTATPTRNLQSGGALMFIVDHDQVIVRGWGSPSDGFRVYDGKPAADLPERLKTPDNILPGPLGRLWVTTYSGDDPTTQLTDLDGRPVRAARGTSSYPADADQSDGDGGLIVSSAGGYYAMTVDGPKRITRGQLLAVGPTVILTADCDRAMHCSRYLFDRDSGQRQRIGPAPVTDNESGTVSRDGRHAALWRWSRYGPAELRIIDLTTGGTLTRLKDPNGTGDTSSLLWLPDGRLIGVLSGRIFVYDPTTGKVTKPDLRLPDGIQQLGLRTHDDSG